MFLVGFWDFFSNFSVGQQVVSVGFWDFFQVFQLNRKSFQLAHERLQAFSRPTGNFSWPAMKHLDFSWLPAGSFS